MGKTSENRLSKWRWETGSILTFYALTLFIAFMICALDARTPDYVCRTPLELGEHDFMSVFGVEQIDDYTVQLPILSESQQDGLTLIISNSSNLIAWQDGLQIYASRPDDVYRRSQIIPLQSFIGETVVKIAYTTQNRSNWPTRHILIGRMTQALQRSESASSINVFFLGLMAMMMLSSLVLYARKSSEKYLLHLAIAALLSFVNLSVSFSLSGALISYKVTSLIRTALLAVCPWQFLLMLTKLYPRRPSRILKSVMIALQGTAILIALAVMLGWVSSPVSYFYRLLVAPVAVIYLSDALKRKEKDVLPVFIAYAAMEGICLSSYVASMTLHYGMLFGFYRVIELSHCLFLIVVTVAVNSRFAHHFSHSESLQRELSELNATLETKVEARTRDLKEQQRRRQTTMQNIFHDLRSPLTVLRSQVNQMPEGDPIRRNLDQRLSYMQRLTEELFFVSNLESHNVIFDEDDVDITALAEHVGHGIEPLAVAKQVKVTFSGVPAKVWGDALRLEQAIQNLADNALHHVNDGGSIRIAVTVSGKNAEITVCNTGSAISDQDMPFVFERYYRSKKKHDPHSSGLGLSIAKEIVQAHDGSITVKSSNIGETEFTVNIPVL